MYKPRKFNVALVSSPMAATNLSIETSLLNFISMIEPLSNKIFLITGNFNQNFPSNKVIVKSIKYSNKKGSKLERIGRYFLMQLKLAKSLASILDDADIVMFYIGSTLLIPLVTAKLLRRKTLVVATGSVSKSLEESASSKLSLFGIFKLIERMCLFLADKIAVESPSVINFLGLERYREKVLVCFARYVDTTLFNVRKSFSDRQNIVVYVGRLSREKGVLNFIEAVPKVIEKNAAVSFHLIGNGPLFSEIQHRIEKNGLSEKVTLIGWVPHENLPGYLNEARLLVLPSYSEGLPGIIAESMACGTIILATNVGGIPDLVKDSVTGFTLADNSSSCIAMRITDILEREGLEEISKNAIMLVKTGFSYDSVLDINKNALSKLDI